MLARDSERGNFNPHSGQVSIGPASAGDFSRTSCEKCGPFFLPQFDEHPVIPENTIATTEAAAAILLRVNVNLHLLQKNVLNTCPYAMFASYYWQEGDWIMFLFNDPLENATRTGSEKTELFEQLGKEIAGIGGYRLTVLLPAGEGRLRLGFSGLGDVKKVLRKLGVNHNPDKSFAYMKVDALRKAVDDGEGGYYRDAVEFAGQSLEKKLLLKTAIKAMLAAAGIDRVLVAPLPVGKSTGVIGLSGRDVNENQIQDLRKLGVELGKKLQDSRALD